ncbi:dihydrodipicolinate synthase family protein [Paenarthrobacter histidinolovorans]|uniref:Dihydrodipicolinate synthase family protein n=1 Tax=Paenarthrobacter histidinolovorans TaxID=43664 RepID=A0ABW8N7A3_9MICC
MSKVLLINEDGRTSQQTLHEAPAYNKPSAPLSSRTAYAAAHVVPQQLGNNVPGAPADIDWDTTLQYRHHLWSWGLGVADAMDTAQRNMGLDAVATRELIRRSAAEARSVGGSLVVGVNTDHVEDEVISLEAVVDAYTSQLHFAEEQGAGVVLMASRHLARAASTAADYRRVYSEVLARASRPVILHWLGAAFDPLLGAYFGSIDFTAASTTALEIMTENQDKVSGIKMSLLDARKEIHVREQLPSTATMFTGDDFNYVGLIGGDTRGHSDALLGAFAALGPSASAALQALDAGDSDAYHRILGPTEELSRKIFESPTYHYKTGVAFMSWLNGHQPAFSMIGGLHSARSLPHLSDLVRLADASGALEQPDVAAERWNNLLALNGIR